MNSPTSTKKLLLKTAFKDLTRYRASRGHNDIFLHIIVIDDEKWGLYPKEKNQRSKYVDLRGRQAQGPARFVGQKMYASYLVRWRMAGPYESYFLWAR